MQKILIVVVLVATSLGAGASVRGAEAACKPAFADTWISICAPTGSGWRLVKGADGGAPAYGKRGRGRNETFAATAGLAPLPEVKSSEDFTALINEQVEASAPPDRFTRLSWDVGPTDERSYPCVRFQGTSEDHSTQFTAAGGKPLILQMIALYCQHPANSRVSLFAVYSHRGAKLYPKLETEANAFINGVQVPPPPVAQVP